MYTENLVHKKKNLISADWQCEMETCYMTVYSYYMILIFYHVHILFDLKTSS